MAHRLDLQRVVVWRSSWSPLAGCLETVRACIAQMGSAAPKEVRVTREPRFAARLSRSSVSPAACLMGSAGRGPRISRKGQPWQGSPGAVQAASTRRIPVPVAPGSCWLIRMPPPRIRVQAMICPTSPMPVDLPVTWLRTCRVPGAPSVAPDDPARVTDEEHRRGGSDDRAQRGANADDVGDHRTGVPPRVEPQECGEKSFLHGPIIVRHCLNPRPPGGTHPRRQRSDLARSRTTPTGARPRPQAERHRRASPAGCPRRPPAPGHAQPRREPVRGSAPRRRAGRSGSLR